MYSGGKTNRAILKLQNCFLYILKYRESKRYNKPVNISNNQLAEREKGKKIKDSASTMDTEGKWNICTKHGNGENRYKFTWSRQRVNSHIQRGKNKAPTMLQNRKETELVSENNRKRKLTLTAFHCTGNMNKCGSGKKTE